MTRPAVRASPRGLPRYRRAWRREASWAWRSSASADPAALRRCACTAAASCAGSLTFRTGRAGRGAGAAGR
eukprot:2247511-Prymnesium_polylepis.1